MTKVFVPHRNGHDHSDARRYGELVYLVDGPVDYHKPHRHFREVLQKLQHSKPYDLILVDVPMPILVMAAGIMSRLHPSLTLLIHHAPTDEYNPARIAF